MTDPGTAPVSTAPPDDRNPDPELEAIHAVLRALAGLDDEGRQRVVDYVFRRLGLILPLASERGPASAASTPSPPANVDLRTAAVPPTGAHVRDIRSLKDAKQPRSAIEMAVLVAYYLSEIAPQSDRKSEIGTDDINKYFKQADFPLPGRPRKTLLDAKAAGYIDSAARGAYKLNPVGHNLIAHGLPASGDNATPRRARTTAKKKAGTRRKARK